MVVNYFKEYGAEDAPSIVERSEKVPYDGMDKIVDFLDTKGEVGIVSADIPRDLITGERIDGELYTKKIDGFSWWSDLPYHVRKYNLRLPKKFEDYVLSHSA